MIKEIVTLYTLFFKMFHRVEMTGYFREMHSGRSEMDDFSGWGADQQDNKDSERPLATKEGVDKPFDAYGRKVEEPWEAEEVPRQKSPKEDKGAER